MLAFHQKVVECLQRQYGKCGPVIAQCGWTEHKQLEQYTKQMNSTLSFQGYIHANTIEACLKQAGHQQIGCFFHLWSHDWNWTALDKLISHSLVNHGYFVCVCTDTDLIDMFLSTPSAGSCTRDAPKRKIETKLLTIATQSPQKYALKWNEKGLEKYTTVPAPRWKEIQSFLAGRHGMVLIQSHNLEQWYIDTKPLPEEERVAAFVHRMFVFQKRSIYAPIYEF